MTTNILIEQTTVNELADILTDRIVERLGSQGTRQQHKTTERKINVTEFCRRAGISRKTFFNWKNRGIIPAERPGGTGPWLMVESEVSQFLKS